MNILGNKNLSDYKQSWQYNEVSFLGGVIVF